MTASSFGRIKKGGGPSEGGVAKDETFAGKVLASVLQGGGRGARVV